MNDYIFTTDIYGRHYLSHGSGWRSHKYILKIGEGAKALYFYTQKEVQNYLNKTGKSVNQNASEERNRPEGRTRNVTGTAQPIQKTEKVSSVPVGTGSTASNVAMNRPTSRKKNVTGTAQPIRKGKKVSGGPVGSGYDGSTKSSSSDVRSAVKKATADGKHREVFYRDGQFYVVERSKNKTSATYANDKNATLLGSKEALKNYQKAKSDIRYLKKELKTLKNRKNQTVETSHNITVTEDALKRAEKTLKNAKQAYDRSRTIDEIPDYIYTKGAETIKKIIKKRG